jgi:hypothetical protein
MEEQHNGQVINVLAQSLHCSNLDDGTAKV